MSSQRVAKPQPRLDVRATSVGQPMAVSSLARLLLKLHREPVLQLVTTTTGDDDHDAEHRAAAGAHGVAP